MNDKLAHAGEPSATKHIRLETSRHNPRKKTRGSFALAVLGVSSLLLAGCSQGDSTAHSTDAGSNSPVTLTVWHNTQDSKAVNNLYTAYEQASGNKIQLVDIPADAFETTILTKWAAGDRPDVLEWHPNSSYMQQLNPAQTMVDLSDESFVKKSGTVYDGAGRGTDGKVYAAITTFPETWGLYFNKAVLDGLDLKPATTFPELQAQCAALKAKGVIPMNQAGGSNWPPTVLPLLYASTTAPQGWVKDVLDKKAKINDADSPELAGLNAWASLKAAGCFNSDYTTSTFEDSAKRVYTGQAAYDMIHSNIASVYLDAAGGDASKLDATVGFTALGGTSKKTGVDYGPIGSYMIPKNTDAAKQKAALDFVSFITGKGYPQYIQDSGTFPIISGTPDPKNPSELLKSIKAAVDEGPVVGLVGQDLPAGLTGNGGAFFQQFAVGQLTAQQVVDKMQQEFESAAKAQGVKGF